MFLHLRKRETSEINQESLDEALVEKYLATGNKDLIAVLFERYTHLVYGICLNYLSDTDQCKDAVMDIFESLFLKLANHKILNFRNWLYSVTRNHCLMIIRKAGSVNRMKAGYERETLDDSDYTDYEEEDDCLMYNKTTIASAVEQLNLEQGTCIKLMYVEDKSYRDIASITGYTLNEVKSYIQNGKRNLKNFLLKQEGNANL